MGSENIQRIKQNYNRFCLRVMYRLVDYSEHNETQLVNLPSVLAPVFCRGSFLVSINVWEIGGVPAIVKCSERAFAWVLPVLFQRDMLRNRVAPSRILLLNILLTAFMAVFLCPQSGEKLYAKFHPTRRLGRGPSFHS